PVAGAERRDRRCGCIVPWRKTGITARDLDHIAATSARRHQDVAFDGEGQDREPVVVGVLADQGHASGSARPDRPPLAAPGGRPTAPTGIRARPDPRRARKKSCRSSRAAPASTPARTAIVWLRRGSQARSYSEPAAPPFGSAQP